MVEREYLKPLPPTAFELKDYRRAKVQKMGYVYFSPDKSYYSVPHRFIGKQTVIHYTKSMVEVHYDHGRIALHRRNPALGNYNTDPDHLGSTHRFYSEWSPGFFTKKAAAHGEHVLGCIEKILDVGDYPEIGYKRAMGVIQLHKAYGSKRLDDACKRALEGGATTYRHIKNILENNLDKALALDLEGEPEGDGCHIPQHGNIRGKYNYK